MRSLHLRGVAGNAKLRGKRIKLLSCRCCCVQDLRPEEFERQVRRELRAVDRRRPLSELAQIV